MAKTEAAVETNVFAVARLFSEEVEEKKAIFEVINGAEEMICWNGVGHMGRLCYLNNMKKQMKKRNVGYAMTN